MIGDALPDIPDVVEPITAVRCWQLNGPRLLSVNGTMWMPNQPLKAYCKPANDWEDMEDEHPCPGPPLSHGLTLLDWPSPSSRGKTPVPPCGIYGFKDLAYGLRQLRDMRFVWGEVLLWGRVWPSSHGYRAEYGQPLRLFEHRDEKFTHKVKAVSDIYRLPVVPFPLTKDQVTQALAPEKSLLQQVASAVQVIVQTTWRLANG